MVKEVSLELIDGKLDILSTSLEKVDVKVDKIDDRVRDVDKTFVEWRTKQIGHAERIINLEKRVDLLEDVVTKLDQLANWFKRIFWLGVSALILGGGSVLWMIMTHQIQLIYGNP